MTLIKRCHHLKDKRHLAAVLSKPESPGIATTGYYGLSIRSNGIDDYPFNDVKMRLI